MPPGERLGKLHVVGSGLHAEAEVMSTLDTVRENATFEMHLQEKRRTIWVSMLVSHLIMNKQTNSKLKSHQHQQTH